jgi:hypothetical protein
MGALYQFWFAECYRAFCYRQQLKIDGSMGVVPETWMYCWWGTFATVYNATMYHLSSNTVRLPPIAVNYCLERLEVCAYVNYLCKLIRGKVRVWGQN